MAKKVIMPKLGLTMEEGVINKWMVKEGDRIEKGDTVFEVATDKVNMEVEAPASGVLLKILAGEGETIPITQTVAWIGEEGEEVPEEEAAPGGETEPAEVREEKEVETPPAVSAPAESTPPTQKKEEAAAPAGRVKASPLAKKLAAQYGVDLSTLKGSGPGGRIVRDDVEKAREEKPVEEPAPVSERPVPTEEGVARIPLSRMRRIIAQRMQESFQNKPHFSIRQEIHAGALVDLRGRLLPVIEKQTGKRLTYTDLIVKMVARALDEYPLVNAHYTSDAIQMNTKVNVGVAVALDDGLIVPVVHNANRKGLAEITSEIHDLSERAREGKLIPEEISGGTFTVSNLGMFGVDDFTAVINAPESAILACGAIKKKPYVKDDAVVPASMLTLTLSADHRIVDGSVAAQFMQFLKTLLEEPFSLLI